MNPQQVRVEQLGAASSGKTASGVARAQDLLTNVLPGAVARLKVMRDRKDLHAHAAQPFVEQLGVPSGDYGLPRRAKLGAALMGLYAKWDVTRYWGVDWRDQANRLIERKVLPLTMGERQKALLVTILYETARRLPGR